MHDRGLIFTEKHEPDGIGKNQHKFPINHHKSKTQTMSPPSPMDSQGIIDLAERHHKPLTIGLIWVFHFFSHCVLDPHKSYTTLSFIFALIFTIFFGFFGVITIQWMEVVSGIGEVVKMLSEAAACGVSVYTLYSLIKKTHKRKKRR